MDGEIVVRNAHGELGIAAGQFRITSYNVCYTKLLRAALVRWDRGMTDYRDASGPRVWAYGLQFPNS